MNTNEHNDAIDEIPDDAGTVTDVDEGNLICEINLNADNYRLGKTKAAHDAVLGNIDVSLVNKSLRATEAPHLDTKSITAKLHDVAKTIDLDVSTIIAEQIKDPVLGTVRKWIRKGISGEPRSPEIQQSKGLLRYFQETDRLLIEEEGQLLCINERNDNLGDEVLRNCLPSSHSSQKVSDLDITTRWVDTWALPKHVKMQNGSTTGVVCLIGYVHLLSIASHAIITNRNANIGLKILWKNGRMRLPRFALSTPITKDLFTHQLIEIFIAYWSMMHLPASGWYIQLRILVLKPHSLLSRNGFILLGSLNPLYTIEVLPSLKPISLIKQKKLGITLRPKTAHLPWTNGKVETQNQHIAR